MKAPLQYALLALGGTALFGSAFVGFASLGGAPLHGLPVLGGLFDAPEEADPSLLAELEQGMRETQGAKPEPPPARSDVEVARAGGVLGSFLVPSPYSARELRDLEQELERGITSVREQRAELNRREDAIVQRELALKERYTELDELRNRLEAFDFELRQREAEIDRDEQVVVEREQQSWKDLATFFEDGEAKTAATRLTQFSAEEAARILRTLSVERAGELVNALPPDRYREYLDAYRAAER
jgi:flagellar motility protein MotE (MotC chaperone)